MPATRRILTAVSAATVLATGASATNAGAAVVAVPVGCVVSSGNFADKVLPIVGSGFTPGSVVSLSTSTKSKPTPAFLTSVQVGATGTIFTIAGAATFNSSKTLDQTFNLIASLGGTPVTATTFRQVRGGYTQPYGGSPGRKVRYSARGFKPGKSVYIHFRRGGRTVNNVRLGKANAPCGKVSRRIRLVPVARPRTGTYKVYVDQKSTYSKTTQPQARSELEIRTVSR